MKFKSFVSVLTAASLLLTSGCGAVRHDLQDPGGYPGWLLDRHSFNASSSKKLLLLRATIIFAMAARMGQATVRGEDADAFALSLRAAAREINFAAANLYPVDAKEASLCGVIVPPDPGAPGITAPAPNPAPDTCLGYPVNFESEVPLIEARLIKLVIAALPTDKSRQFLAAVAKGDALGAAFKALGAFKTLAVGLHYANGSYRSGLEIVATQIPPANCAVSPSGGLYAYSQSLNTVHEAVGCIGLPTDSIFSPTDNTRTSFISDVSPTAFDALMRIANGACSALPYLRTDGSSAQPAPAGPVAGGTASPAGAATAAPSLQEESQAREKVCGAIWFVPKDRHVSKAQ